ncbi:MAG: hypothetical protein KC433_28385, partial [Anaerolineales bacterium]|nr:hypothetical protein [Anaerolineales bacterium]
VKPEISEKSVAALSDRGSPGVGKPSRKTRSASVAGMYAANWRSCLPVKRAVSNSLLEGIILAMIQFEEALLGALQKPTPQAVSQN